VRILLDECVPLPLRKLLSAHDCKSAQEMGWNSIKNGELLALAEAQFDLFITRLRRTMARRAQITEFTSPFCRSVRCLSGILGSGRRGDRVMAARRRRTLLETGARETRELARKDVRARPACHAEVPRWRDEGGSACERNDLAIANFLCYKIDIV
jgi:hypothetical protein